MEALLKQLIDQAGVPPAAITLYDAIRYVPDCIYDRVRALGFDAVRFVDWAGGDGREASQRDTTRPLSWSGRVQGSRTYLPDCVTGADYLINLAGLKGHNLAGVTLSAKNHFGTIMADLDGAPTQQAPQGANLHGTVAAHDYAGGAGWKWKGAAMGTYNALVDLMAHPHLGGKTLLYLLDGLYAVPHQGAPVSAECRWQSAPFNDAWTSSLFLSQDGVAIDSVGLDFIRGEPTITALKDVLPPGSTADNYLHEAAQANQPPSGTPYGVESLGIHEHWDDQREYSGIGLVRLS